MKIALGGASGLVGTRLVADLRAEGHEVLRFVRRPAAAVDELQWDPTAPLPPATLTGVDAVVHLGGVSVADGRWTAAQQAAIRDSRVDSSRTLATAIAAAGVPVFVCASATGLYGDGGDTVLTEESPPGEGFLASVCVDWEAATAAAAEAGARVVQARIGIVLDPAGGALGKMLPLFKRGLGSRLGGGRQWMSWIDARDLSRALRFALARPTVVGPINCVAPEPVTNAEFTTTLARALGKRTFLPAPALALKLALGQMAEEALLGSTRALPTRLQAAGFSFEFSRLADSLASLLGR
ncbi:MAG: TIGR01777 family protein [Myxococcales bacterium]|nr:TIGR01777 family protein [Myxococcales bacterium]